MLIPRWRNALTIKNSLVASTQFCAFHSTPTACEKWKNKWDSTFGKAEQRKSYIKYTTRQKRADTKKALKDLLYRSGSRSISFQDEDPLWRFHNKEEDELHGPGRKDGPRKGPKSHYKKMKRKLKKQDFKEEFGKMKKEDFKEEFGMNNDPETVFQATFGNRWYTWSVDPRHSSFDFNTSPGFEWRNHRVNSSWEEKRARKWTFIDEEEEFEQEEISSSSSSSIGSSTDRTLLGLPPRGPLKLEDVKTAFRVSALKWHPDKHQGPSQTVAEEKFKLCVTAYKSLCTALSAAAA